MKTIGQKEMAEKLGITEEELVKFVGLGLPFHAAPEQTGDQYLFLDDEITFLNLLMVVNCLAGGGHEKRFDRYYDRRAKLPVMVCQNCGSELFSTTPYSPPLKKYRKEEKGRNKRRRKRKLLKIEEIVREGGKRIEASDIVGEVLLDTRRHFTGAGYGPGSIWRVDGQVLYLSIFTANNVADWRWQHYRLSNKTLALELKAISK